MNIPQPYWREQRRAFRDGRLRWYGDAPTDAFWHSVWEKRLDEGYFDAADRGDLEDLGEVLTRWLAKDGAHLEAGCGLGYWVVALRARGYDIDGIDSSPDLVKLVNRARPEVPIRHGDALALDLSDSSLDGYLSFGVIEHREQGPEPFLDEATRVLKPGGHIVVTVPYCCPVRRWKARLRLYDRDPDGAFFQYGFRAEELIYLLEVRGFVIRELVYQHPARCLVEEVPLLFHLQRRRGGKYWRRLASRVPGRLAGHTVLVVAERSGASSQMSSAPSTCWSALPT